MSESPPSGLPQGLVTFLFTDVAGSTRLWEQAPKDMGYAMADHDRIVEDAVTTHGGHVVRPRGEGDSRFAVFARPSDAIAAAVDLSLRMAAHPWTTPAPIRVRVAVHTGESDLRDGDYYGRSVNRAARLRAVGNPGQVLVSGTTFDVARDSLPPLIHLVPLGAVQLADLERPEEVYQLQHPDLPAEFGPLRASGRPVVKLPPLVSDFVGREALLDDVAGYVTHQGCRLVTLIGPGGVGKTQVAIATSLQLRDHFPGGVFFVALSNVSSTLGALYALASALEVRESNDEELIDTLCRSLSMAPALIVLDNGEQVIGLDDVVVSLLERDDDLAIIVTSRSPLKLRAEQRCPVPPLDVPDADRSDRTALTLEHATQYPAVMLFTTRAQAVDPSFDLDERSLPAVLEICRRLEGSPLSIGLAAARIDVFDPQQIEERLSAQLSLLASHGADLPERHRSARATVEWSMSLLTPDEREALRCLSLMAGSFTIEDAAGVIGGDDNQRTLVALVDSSLVVATRTAEGRVFRLNEAVREYCREQLDTDALQRAQFRLLQHVTDVVEAQTPGLDTAEAHEAVGAIRRRYEDLRGAVDWALDEGCYAEVAPLLAVARRYWVHDGRLREPATWLRRWLDAAHPADAYRSPIALCAGVLAYLLDESTTATSWLTSVIAEGDAATSALAKGYLGAIRLGDGDTAGAASLAEECEQTAGAGAYEVQSLVLSLHAVIAAVEGDAGSERECYKQRLQLARSHGDDRRVAETLNNLAEVALADSDVEAAQAFASEALDIARRSGRIVTRDALYTHARLDLMCSRGVPALVNARESLRLSLDLGQRFEISQALTVIGAIAISSGEAEQGTALMAAGRSARSATGPPLDIDLEPELLQYRDQASRALSAPAFERAAERGSGWSLEAAVQVAMRILPTR